LFVARVALPETLLFNPAKLFATASRANDFAIRPAKLDHKILAMLKFREVKNRIAECGVVAHRSSMRPSVSKVKYIITDLLVNTRHESISPSPAERRAHGFPTGALPKTTVDETEYLSTACGPSLPQCYFKTSFQTIAALESPVVRPARRRTDMVLLAHARFPHELRTAGYRASKAPEMKTGSELEEKSPWRKAIKRRQEAKAKMQVSAERYRFARFGPRGIE
jgi:hypothetical protein